MYRHLEPKEIYEKYGTTLGYCSECIHYADCFDEPCKWYLISVRESEEAPCGETESELFGITKNVEWVRTDSIEEAERNLACMKKTDTYCPRCNIWCMWPNDKTMKYCPDCGERTVKYEGEWRREILNREALKIAKEKLYNMRRANDD